MSHFVIGWESWRTGKSYRALAYDERARARSAPADERSIRFLTADNDLIAELVTIAGSQRQALELAGMSRSRSHYRLHPRERVADPVPQTPEIARLGRILGCWRGAFLAYFTTNRTNNGGTEAVNGILELHRRLARGYRNRYDYRLRMLLAASGLTP